MIIQVSSIFYSQKEHKDSRITRECAYTCIMNLLTHIKFTIMRHRRKNINNKYVSDNPSMRYYVLLQIYARTHKRTNKYARAYFNI